MMYRMIQSLLLVALLSGCGTLYDAVTKTGQVIWDPSIPIGEPEDRPSTVTIAMLADPAVNPNNSGEPSPIAYQILELRDKSRLMAADFDQLLTKLEPSLGTNYVNHEDFTLMPGEFKILRPEEISGRTHYIGVIAFYARPNQAQWKKVIEVEPNGGDYHLLMNFRESEVVLDKD